MSALTFSPGPGDGDLFDRIADAVERQGYVLLPAVLPGELTDSLFARCLTLDDADFQRAGVGRSRDFHLNRFVRTDEIHWLSAVDAAEQAYLRWMEQLRRELNRRLFLGLFDYEAHFARYAEGAYYKRHVDAFKGRSNRVLSTVFYLNPGWCAADGGELYLYEEDSREPLEKVLPLYGSMAIFLSDRFPHEVLPARRLRLSIAGWFRLNGSFGDFVDPPR